MKETTMVQNDILTGSFALFVKTQRETKGMNKTELSRRSGINRTTLSMMEIASTDPSITNAVRILRALGMTFSDYEQFVGQPRTV